jgi:signal transduction histidine kinase
LIEVGAKMSNSRLELLDLFDQLSFALCIVSKDYEIVRANKYFQSHAIFSTDELHGGNLLALFPESSHYLKTKIDTAFITGKKSFSSWEEMPHVLPFKPARSVYGDADKMYQDLALVPIQCDDGVIEYVCLCVYDTTTIASQDKQLHLVMEQLEAERKQRKVLKQQLEEAQGELMQSEKMASIGQLSTSIAHEIHNPIEFITSNIQTFNTHFQRLERVVDQLKQTIVAQGDPKLVQECQSLIELNRVDFIVDNAHELITESIEASSRVMAIIKNLKEFSHADGSAWSYTSLKHCIESTLKIINNEIKYGITIERDYQNDVPDIFCQPMQINQVLLNLLVNAIQAIEKEGIIKISLNKIDAKSVEIRVKDNGSGIKKELQEKVFEPFFTTKAVSSGTGLGLSVSHGIIKAHKGKIQLNSEVDVGTEFIITLPI